MTSRFAKFMNLKDFHPSNYQNQKKVWIAREREKQKQKEVEQLDREYQKEHGLLTVKALAPTSDKNKLALSFMYNEPPGFAEAQEKLVMKTQKKPPIEEKDDQGRRKPIPLEEKFEFLKNAPVQGKFVAEQGNIAHMHKPFGIQIRNVKCTKCGAYGHQRTDRECPKYGELIGGEDDKDVEAPREGFQDPMELMRQMREGGLAIKRSVLGRQNNALEENQQFVLSDDGDGAEDEAELEFLKSLSTKEKKRLLKKLSKMDADEGDEGLRHKKKSKKNKKSKKRRKSSDGSSSDSSAAERKRKRTSESAKVEGNEARDERHDRGEHHEGRKKDMELQKDKDARDRSRDDRHSKASGGDRRSERRRSPRRDGAEAEGSKEHERRNDRDDRRTRSRRDADTEPDDAVSPERRKDRQRNRKNR